MSKFNYNNWSMFEQSTVYRLIKNSGFPFIVRHNRAIYATQPYVIDPALIFRRMVFASIVGYFVGRKLGHKQTLCFFGFGSLVLLWHLAIDLKLKSEGKYQELYVPPLIQWQTPHAQKQTHKPRTPAVAQSQPTQKFRVKPLLGDIENTQIDKLIDSLPKNYFI